MTVAEAIRKAVKQLETTSDTARLDAELLMANALGASRSDMLLRHMDSDPPPTFAKLLARRAQNEPIAYITGVQEFFGRSFAVTSDTLIPRADTETLIETSLELAPRANRVLDLGTGTGALLITAMIELGSAGGIGTDCSQGALEVACANAKSLGLDEERAQFLCLDWTKPNWREGLGRFDLILSNPPYVELGAQLDADVRDFEPSGALFAGEEGLDDYQVLIPVLRSLLNDGAIAILEIGASQAEAVTRIAHEQGFDVTLRKDLSARPRCLVLR